MTAPRELDCGRELDLDDSTWRTDRPPDPPRSLDRLACVTSLSELLEVVPCGRSDRVVGTDVPAVPVRGDSRCSFEPCSASHVVGRHQTKRPRPRCRVPRCSSPPCRGGDRRLYELACTALHRLGTLLERAWKVQIGDAARSGDDARDASIWWLSPTAAARIDKALDTVMEHRGDVLRILETSRGDEVRQGSLEIEASCVRVTRRGEQCAVGRRVVKSGGMT